MPPQQKLGFALQLVRAPLPGAACWLRASSFRRRSWISSAASLTLTSTSSPTTRCGPRPSGPPRHNLRTRTWVAARNHRRITAPHTRTFNHGTALARTSCRAAVRIPGLPRATRRVSSATGSTKRRRWRGRPRIWRARFVDACRRTRTAFPGRETYAFPAQHAGSLEALRGRGFRFN